MKGKFQNGLKAAMEERGIGVTELARLADTSKQNIQRWAAGTRKLPIEWAKKIAPLLETTAQEIFFGSDRLPAQERVIKAMAAATPEQQEALAALVEAFVTTGTQRWPPMNSIRDEEDAA